MRSITSKLISCEIEFGHHCVNPKTEDPAAEACDLLTAAHHSLCACGIGGTYTPASFVAEFDSAGFRVYSDHHHHEISGPLCASAVDFVLMLRQMRKNLARYLLVAERVAGPINVYFDNTNRDDVNGRSWGCHMNAKVSRAAFDSWSANGWKSEPMIAHWLPFISTSPPLFGSGKTGAENGSAPVRFQLSQRSDHMTQISCLATVEEKGLINERDEPLGDAHRLARFHVVALDTPRAEFASFLRAGVIQCLLAVLEEGLPLPNLSLENPLAAMADVSRDLSMRRPVRLADGRTATALEIQYRLAEAVQDQLRAGCAASSVPDAEFIVACWIETLDHLSKHSSILCGRLDWRARLELIRQARRGVPHSTEVDLLSDIQYGQFQGPFEKLEESHAIERLEDFFPRKRLGTFRLLARDMARAKFLSRFSAHVLRADWHTIVVNDKNDRLWEIRLDSQASCRQVVALATKSYSWNTCLRKLRAEGVAVKTELADMLVIEVSTTNPKEQAHGNTEE